MRLPKDAKRPGRTGRGGDSRERNGVIKMVTQSPVIRKTQPDTNAPFDLHDLELRARLDALRYTRADLAEIYGPEAEYSRWMLGELEQALRYELRRRIRLHRAGADVPDPFDARHDAWLALAAEVRERADIVQVLTESGHMVYSTRGYSKRREAEEWAGPCPWCGGRDRFRVWRGRDSGFWCRQCGMAGDVIALVRNLVPDCEGFYAAVGYLARMLGLPLPVERDVKPSRSRKRRPVTRIVGGKVVAA